MSAIALDLPPTCPLVIDPAELRRALSDLEPGAAPRLHLLARLARRLEQEQPHLERLMMAETGYTRGECAALLDAAYRFATGLDELMTLHRALAAAESEGYADITEDPGAEIELRPWGRCLICTPANAPAPLALALPLALVAAGNQVVLAPSGKARGTALRLGRLVAETVGGVVLWDGRVRDAITALIGDIDLVYYLGGSSAFPELAATCARAGVELLYEGEGNGVAVVDRGMPLAAAIPPLVAAKTAFGGRMCSAPNAIAVPRGTAGEFAAAWRRHPGAPALTPADSLAGAVERELFRPEAFLVEFADWGALARDLAAVRHRLQLSIFSRDERRIEELIAATRFARYAVNRCPIDQDPLLPWGGYGRSGRADVLDFYRKGLRRVIVERGGVS
ncbi:MAG TPA: aldehyde dehydrogenase family protein [Kofleriaceae bacterium]|nr:aldehyde dehydrogenase family protein [Kofleriaceae bacterium]